VAAVAAFRKALEINPKYIWARYELGCLQAEIGDYAGAAATLQKVVELSPNDAFLRYALGIAHLAAGQRDAHRRVCADMLKFCDKTRDPAWADRTLNTALPAADAKADASVLVPLAVRAAGVQPANVRLLGAALYRTGEYEDAVERFNEAAKFMAPRAWDHFFLAMAHHRLGQTEKARAYLALAANQLITSGYSWQERAESESLCREAEVLLGLDRHELAIAACREALAKTPDDAKAHNNLAWLLATSPNPMFRDPGQAIKHAQRAVELTPKDGNPWNTLGVAQCRAGDWKAALASLEKSMELRHAGDSFDWFFLAMAHWQLDDKVQARTWYDRAVLWMQKHQPRNEELRRFRAETEKLLQIKNAETSGLPMALR
jgi:tetratricopeptide (TPR) repeat protein